MKPKSAPPAAIVLVALLAGAASTCAAQSPDRFRGEVFPKVRITRDVVYRMGREAGGGKTSLLLDVYEPEGDAEMLRPVMVWIHGGGFFQGDKADLSMVNLSMHFARCGFVCASINYTLALESPADWDSGGALRRAADRATEDARSALCFLASQRERFRIDVGRLIVGGGSAGAFTALQLGCDESGPCGTRVRGIVDFWGGLMDISMLRRASPPILAIHGTADRTVPYAFAERLVARGKEVDARVELHTLENEGHAAWSRMEQYFDWIHAFMPDVLP